MPRLSRYIINLQQAFYLHFEIFGSEQIYVSETSDSNTTVDSYVALISGRLRSPKGYTPNARINRAARDETSIQASRMKAALLPLRLNELLGAA